MLVQAVWTAWDGGDNIPFPQRWTAAQCPRCLGAALYLQEDVGSLSAGGWDEHWQVYPPQARRMSLSVPKALRVDHEEAQRCLEAKCYSAAAIMARRIIEGICRDQGYQSGDLFRRLKAMRDAGAIDARLYEWADAAREVGNEGAHASDAPVTREDAEEVLNFVEGLLDYLYVFQARFDDFKERRAERTLEVREK